MIRRFRQTDLPAIREIHKRAGYGFDLPNVGTFEISYVVEENGRVIGWLGAEIHAELIGVFDQDYASPHERLRAFIELHVPIAEQLKLRGIKEAYVKLDPKFKRFGKRMLQLFWKQSLWEHYYLRVDECLRRYRKV